MSKQERVTLIRVCKRAIAMERMKMRAEAQRRNFHEAWPHLMAAQKLERDMFALEAGWIARDVEGGDK